jgi:hypothetical protein
MSQVGKGAAQVRHAAERGHAGAATRHGALALVLVEARADPGEKPAKLDALKG